MKSLVNIETGSIAFLCIANQTDQRLEHCTQDFSDLVPSYEPHREKTGFLPGRKQRRRSASR